jgi:hypothetical protein
MTANAAFQTFALVSCLKAESSHKDIEQVAFSNHPEADKHPETEDQFSIVSDSVVNSF